ncbi:hypothetical protein FDP22_05080 [Paroceanicella profunda]|uniref:Uncharacterized protein n=2 Tax=Paroceanicella profunda TaxID=2579971 RepID=A0A5B8FIX9_9RHOB|nr:hypothetical protein FDP22_05080 [Paroceanicella profunda]
MALLALSALRPASAGEDTPPDITTLITPRVIAYLRDIGKADIIELSVAGQNARYGELPQSEIDRLDTQWRTERKSVEKPLIAMTLSRPLSIYLIRIQSDRIGLLTAIFAMDRNGLNVGQSAPTSDFWQGDEDKFLQTYPIGPDAVHIGEVEWVPEWAVWIGQVSLTLTDRSGQKIGAITFDINLDELARRQGVNLM